MKKLAFISLVFVFTLVGCVNRANTTTDSTDNNSIESENNTVINNSNNVSDLEDESSEGTNSGGDSTGEGDEQQSGQDGSATDTQAPDYGALLAEVTSLFPENVTLGEKDTNENAVWGGEAWFIQKGDFVSSNEYLKHLSFQPWYTTAGFVEIAYSPEYPLPMRGDIDCPSISIRPCEEQYNHEELENGWFFEAKMLLFDSVEISTHDIPTEQRYSYFWCIMKWNSEDCTTWVFLNQECFTKEEAMVIAKELK